MTHTTNPTEILGIAVVISCFILVHLARRYPTIKSGIIPAEDVSFTRFQRAMHWLIASGSVFLFVTGLPVYLSQFLFSPPISTPLYVYYWGFPVYQWRDLHIYFALFIVGVVLLHAGWDAGRLKRLRAVVLSKKDILEGWGRIRSFLGIGKPARPQRAAKYDFFHKAYHLTLLALGAFLLVSGLLEWEALKISGVPLFVLLDRVNHTFMDELIRPGHLVAAMVFAGLMVVHVYFAVLPQNRPFLRSIILGDASGGQDQVGRGD